MDARRHLKRMIAVLAGLAALFAAFLPPVGYYVLSSRYEQGILTAIAELESEHVSELVVQAPDLWQYQAVRLEELLERRNGMGKVQLRKITSLDGQTVIARGQHPAWPYISGSCVIHDAGIPVARIEIVQSMLPTLGKALIVGLLSSVVSIVVFRITRTLPTRAVAAAHRSLLEGERKYRSLFLGINEAVLLLEVDRIQMDAVVVEANPACDVLFSNSFLNLADVRSSQLFGSLHTEIIGLCLFVLDNGVETTVERELPEADKVVAITIVPADKQRVAVIFSDVTEHRAAERQVQQLVSFDFLTGLPNRALLQDRLKQAMAACERHNCKLAVFFVDLDHFKAINDSLGHAVGDTLLQAVANRLTAALRQSDTVARSGGDEFVIFTMGLHDELNASLVASHILTCFDEPFLVAGRELYATASLGIAVYPDDATDIDALLKYADMALYEAKEQGRNRYRYFSVQLQERALEHLEVETSLRRAIAENLLSLVYQPQFDARTGTLIGMEALLRWNNPDGTPYLSPLQIITIAEKTGLIIPIGEWVLNTACKQLRLWKKAGYRVPRLAINFSAVQFEQPELVSMIQEVLEKNQLTPDSIEVELTESAIMRDPGEATAKLRNLKQLGVFLAVDDFGTGYSSLSYLKLFPIDRIKIDRSFIREAPANTDDCAIIETIISLARNMRTQVIAEGVERTEQVEFLLERGCYEMQGYHFSRPLQPEQCESYLIANIAAELKSAGN